MTNAFTPTSKRRNGFPSETNVKRAASGSQRGVETPVGFKEFVEKLGRQDLCPCGSGSRF
jgi:hypothetical protein